MPLPAEKKKPPLPKGRCPEGAEGYFARRAICRRGGIKEQAVKRMERKHNTSLTSNAKTLRKNMTKEERHLWYDFLRSYPVRFLRQKVIDNYIVDFYCHDARLIVELDGSQHYDPKEQKKDQQRTEDLQSRGLRVIRIPNNEIAYNFAGVCEYIDLCVQQLLKESPSHFAFEQNDSPL